MNQAREAKIKAEKEKLEKKKQAEMEELRRKQEAMRVQFSIKKDGKSGN